MDRIVRALTELIRCEIEGTPAEAGLLEGFTHEDWEALYTLANRHDLAHLPGDILVREKLLPPEEKALSDRFGKVAFTALFRAQRLTAELLELRRVLSEAGIPFIPLKGSVLRPLYPAAWMRTSADIDVLVHEEDLDKTLEVLTRELSYEFDSKCDHHVGGFGKAKVHLEVHMRLVSRASMPRCEELLSYAWDYAFPTGEGSEWQFSDGFFYYFFMAHAAKHFIHGGCGMRPFIDLWIMRRTLPENGEKRKELLKKGNMEVFAHEAETLSRVWFEGGEPTDFTSTYEQYLLSGGTYGTASQYAAMGIAQTGNKWKYMWSRIWLPRTSLATLYPVVRKHPILIPFCQAARWFARLFDGGVSRGSRELLMDAGISDTDRAKAMALLERLEL